jgi:hypothetical protein
MAIEARNEERLESPQVHTGYVLLCALVSLAILGGAIATVDAVYYQQVSVQSFPAPRQFPQPRVQTGQRAQLRDLQKQQLGRLHAYHWVDQKNGLIEIPIDRAMQILAGEGLHAYAPLAPAQALSSPSAGAERLQTPQAPAPAPAAPAPSGGKP